MGAGVLAATMAGCGETAEPADNTDSSETSDLTLEELFAKTSAASEEANSFHMDMVTNQTMVMGAAEGMNMDMKIDMSMDMTLDPLAFYQKGQSTFVSEGMEDMPAMETEMYYTPEGIYSYDPMMDAWLKMPAGEMEELEAMMEQQSGDLSGQLEQLEAFQDDFTFEQSGDEFILTLDAAGEEYEKLISEQMDQVMGDIDINAQEILNGMTINRIYYEIFIDKETLLPNTMNIIMDFDMEMEGESVSILSDIQAEYSNYNGIDAITVPAEVIENAEEI